jgi:hypothetical protein
MFSKAVCKSLPLFLAAALVVPAGASAADAPKRKAGLWEIKTQSDNMPGAGMAIQQCIDQNTDNLMQQRAQEKKPDCSAMDIKRDGDRVTLHAVCKFEGTTATTDATYVGNFESGYKGDMRSTYSPPMHGISSTHMTQEARWLGACKPGQKPGDVIMPNMGSMNMNEMMKDPRVLEAMKRQAQH